MKNKAAKPILTLSIVVLAITGISNACGQLQSTKNLVSDLESSALSMCKTPEALEPIAGQRSIATVYGSNVFENMVTCTGLGKEHISQTTMDEENVRLGSFSEYGDPDKITSAKMMGIAAVAVEVCSDLVKKERELIAGNPPNLQVAADYRKFFNAIDFDGDSVNPTSITETAERAARSCWSRELTQEENQIILENINAMRGVDNESVAIAICTSILSSLSGIVR